MQSSPRILVMGCGGIGGIVTSYLSEVGADVTCVTTNERIAAAVREHGFELRGDGEPRSIAGRIEVGVPAGETFDLVLLATQPPSVEDAARAALPHLAERGHFVVFQNGLCEARVARLAGEERVIGAIIAWGASMPEPGVYDRTASGGFTMGRLAGPPRWKEAARSDAPPRGSSSGTPDSAVAEVARLLEVIGPVTLTDNLMGARWSKLAINCAISSLGTIAGERLGSLVRSRRVRRLGLEVMTEVVEVARKERVKLEKVAGTIDLEWMAMPEAERRKRGSAGLTARHPVLLGVGLRYRRMRSSMLSAIERGRPPAIDFLNGEIVDRARLHGIEVPINERIVATVHAIARGEARSDRALLLAMYEDTQHLRG